MQNKFVILNAAPDADTDQPVVIDVEGIIGFEPWWKEDAIVRTKEKMKDQLKAIAAIDPRRAIRVEINSYGGDVNHGISIHDLLANHPGPVTTHVYGHTASAATVIAQAGKTRTISANALYLVHQSQTLAAGTAEDMDHSAKMLRKVNDQLVAVYAKRSGRTADQVREVMDRNRGQGEWLTADEAKDLGFVDDVVEPFAAAATASPDAVRLAGLPPIPENKLTKKGPLAMLFGLFKNKTELVDALEDVDKAVEAKAAEIRAELAATVTALEADKARLTAELETEKAGRAAAETAVVAAQAAEAAVRAELAEATAKAARLAASAEPKAAPTVADTGANARFRAAVDAKIAAGMDYDDAAVAVRRENPDLFADMIADANKKTADRKPQD